MTVGIPAGEGRYTDAPTVPQEVHPYSAGRGGYGSHGGYGGYQPRPGRRRRLRRTRRLFAVLLGLAFVTVMAVAGGLLVTPSVGNAPELAQAFDRAHGAPYPGPPVPVKFAQALVATEDHRFYREPGIDPFAVARVVRGRITGQPDQGGATLYQQLAKMLYTPSRSGVLVELEQIVLGVKLDVSYSKAAILQMYADVAYFGHGYYGLARASCGYFGVTPAGLSWPQAALLAGLVQAPSADNPIGHYAVARAREAHVLGRLAATGKLTQTQADRAFGQLLHLAGGPGTGCAAR